MFLLLGSSGKQKVQEVNISLVIHRAVIVANMATLSNSSTEIHQKAQNGRDVATRLVDSFKELGLT
jgi:hypothetical protein